MTYPPQNGPSYGQQPGPYGPGQPYQGQPGQPRQPYPAQQYPPQQQYPGHYPGQGYPPPGPPKKKTGLIVGISAGAVALLALGVTGFIAPGFFLGGSTSATGSAADAASSFANALTAHKQEAVSSLYCADASAESRKYGVDIVNKGFTVTLDEPPVGDKAQLTVDNAGNKIMFDAALANQGGKWCVQKMTVVFARMPGANGGTPAGGTPTGGQAAPSTADKPATGLQDGEAAARKFVDAVNHKDEATAVGMACKYADSIVKSGFNRIGADPAITMAASARGSDTSPAYTFEGSAGGRSIYLTVRLNNADGTGFCVQDLTTVVH